MGTYRTNKIFVQQAYEIDRFKCDENFNWNMHVKTTEYTQFEAPLYKDFVWSLGEMHTEAAEGEKEELQDFLDKPLYKVVSREGKVYLLIMRIMPDSKVYAGSSTGKGLYFETSIQQALGYHVVRDSGRKYDDIIKINDKDLEPQEEKVKVPIKVRR